MFELEPREGYNVSCGICMKNMKERQMKKGIEEIVLRQENAGQ